ncbi:MAG TPA: hypothetical protein VM621_12545 [Luteibacter sp.]|uniref:hypothetical protein n=1 Tax=Luteibacter sp. TaxID=1886636 RepID=UPI002B6D2352|nr:hypothetical protein [Luteibacter sp.]HVI55864.1 hypothetical protein [Luteibacter sp.]
MNQIALSKVVPAGIAGSVSQGRLDVSERSRHSRLPWRGQFSPELVEYLFELVGHNVTTAYDPFCGSGTVLYEALGFGFHAIGTEINPAAWHLAVLSRYSKLGKPEKLAAKADVASFAMVATRYANGLEHLGVLEHIQSHELPFSRLATAACFILAMGNGQSYSENSMTRACRSVLDMLDEMDATSFMADCVLGDARSSSLPDASIDLVVTSPPYINVFNYHQNYRPAAERLGWTPLKAAPAEIGSNRKNRSNRFHTVTQYCLDMRASLSDIGRVMRENGRLVMILGRTSNVLGTSFENGEIVKRLLADMHCFNVDAHETRSFLNRFGEEIKEDMFFVTRNNADENRNGSAYGIALDTLVNARPTAPDKSKALLDEAIEKSSSVAPSPAVALDFPAYFA